MPEAATPPSAPPTRCARFGWPAIVLVAIISAVLAGGGVLLLSRGAGPGHEGAAHVKAQYQCPMHPSIIQEHPGDCPICGMKLVKVESWKGPTSSSASSPAEGKIAFYRSLMDPKQTSPTPRKDEMGMDYAPVFEDEVSGGGSSVPGLAGIGIDPERQQLIGLKTAEVVRGLVGGQVRTFGRVAIDETRVRHINVKNGGFVERIFVDFIGKRVKRGDPLFTLFSPELLAAQNEFLLALRTRGTLGTTAGSGDSGKVLVDSARRRLALWDVSTAEMQRLEATGQPTKTLTFYSPTAGVVTKKGVVEGMKLEAGAMPYEIVDLSVVWVLADVYESELRFVKEGTPAKLKLKAFPDRTFEGKVTFLDPLLDPQTRTVKVRLTFPNPSADLRPEMFGEVVLKIASHEGLQIPADAIVDSGTAKVVFVAQGEGKFQPRQIEVGQSDGTVVEVTSGLHAGDLVVTRANFLIDSESRLRSSLNAMSPAEGKQSESARVLPLSGTQGAGQKAPAGKDATPGHVGHQP
ncbi:MAG: efflux transporter periplasmic adaptor subunit [Deltaproteobacteria bacterium RIFOXYA12_FULL_61_11]|nr:MAG: efflux transporter periplasmic adaptor subunit [Deltaproteobacteria bacterium RIFOXYA12_FULL_61_11]